MAVKWAVANGQWSAGATWNDGVVPTEYDDIYCNGKTIDINVDISTRGIITNEVCPATNVSGGFLNVPSSISRNIYANKFIAHHTYLIQGGVGSSIYIVGDVKCPEISNTYCIITTYSGAGNNIVINGNVDTSFGGLLNHGAIAATLIINGNFNAYGNGNLFYGSASRNITINGNTTINGKTVTCNNITFNGITDLYNDISITATTTISGQCTTHYCTLATATLRVSGNLKYLSSNNILGFRYTNLTILNPDTFTWKDVTEPRSNPFVILTDAEMNNRQQYPPENEVKEGTEYVWGEKVGTYQQPPESVVLKDYVYDNGDKIGTLENQTNVGCVTKEDVREGVELIGMGEVGTLVVPDVDDVREGVVFDNGSVGTLIVEGGGDRLRIADFGYYTNAQSDTYIVDLTEQDKPKFAVAEERVLIEMFPGLDLDNIPDKYFDDLFVKYLKYRLIVEYYRTAGINSTFTPSEPTTEIVNYRNVNCEIWMNIANTYLKAWGEKYPNSIKKQRILL